MDSIPSQLLLQVILIFLNAFFAATEIAVLSVNKTQLKKKAEKGEKTAKRLLLLLQEPAGFLSTIQIGITLAGFLASAFAADNFAQYLVDWVYNDIGYRTGDIPCGVMIQTLVNRCPSFKRYLPALKSRRCPSNGLPGTNNKTTES